jgi:hypothetical protein
LFSSGESLLMPNTTAPALTKASYSSRNLHTWVWRVCEGWHRVCVDG